MAGVETLLRLKAGDPEAAAVVAEAWQRWLADDTSSDPRSLMARLGLPASRVRQLIGLRDAYLLAACQAILPAAPGTKPYRRAQALREAIHLFARHRWPAWQRLDNAPIRATDAEHLLFQAFRHATWISAQGAHLPDRLGKSALLKLLTVR